MKLDVNVLRYLSREDFRVLTSVEMGQKNHELVPMQLIDSISGLKHGGAYRSLKTLLKHKLVHHESQKYDGYRLTYMGYDFLAIKTLVARGHISGVGRQIGVGKESDIFEVTNDEGEVFALKLHRLGRTSFRDVKSKRDYLGTRSNYSWLYLSRLAALKEFAFMKALSDHGFPVPTAIDNNRHAVLMELVEAQPLVQVRELGHPSYVYSQAMDLIHRLAACGLVHCDFNEFNLLIDESEHLTLIDFPQMVSVSHANAEELFERDVDCIVRFFNKKIGYMAQQDESLKRVRPSFGEAAAEAAAAGASGLDVELAASGFKRQHQQTLEEFAAAAAAGGADDGAADSEESEPDGDEEEDAQSQPSDAGREACSDSGSTPEAAAEAGPSRSTHHNGSSKGGTAADAEQLAQQFAAQQVDVGVVGPGRAGQPRRAAVSASMQQWLDEHVGEVDPDAAAIAAAVAAAAGGGAMPGAAAATTDTGCSQPGDGGHSTSSQHSGEVEAEDAGRGQQQQQQQHWEQASAAHSRAPTDISFMGREVQQRLVAQRQKAAARAFAAKATRNVSKARGKKAKATAAALAEW